MNKRYIVTPDKHFPLADTQAIRTLCKSIGIIRPDGYIDLGDTGEWNTFSAWKWKRKAKPRLEWYLPELITEVAEVNKGMDLIDEALDKAHVKERHFCQGNHEVWMDNFIEEYPYLPQYGTYKALNLKGRGYDYHLAGKMLKIGKLNFYHGHLYGGMHHAANHLRRYGTDIMYGHFHDIQVSTGTSDEGPVTAYSIGCLKSLLDGDNQFLRNRPTNWKHAFAVVDFIGKGHHVSIIEIVNGRAVWGDQIIAS